MLIYDQPRSCGVRNALDRAHHLLNIRWIPQQEVVIKEAFQATSSYLNAARNGKKMPNAKALPIPYSSARMLDGLVGVDISIDTFVSAVRNPASIVYTRNIGDFDDESFHCTIKNSYFAYGTVCSAFVNYVLDLPIHRCTHEWGGVPEFYEVSDPNADALALCDTLVTTRADGHTGGHVRIVTGIARDAQHRVQMVEISEGRTVYPGSQWYSAAEVNQAFINTEKKQRVFRYRYLDSVTPPEPLMTPDQDELMLDRGAFSNYRVGEPVEFNICCEAEKLVITGEGASMEVALDDLAPTLIQGNAYKIYRTSALAPGRYAAHCVNGAHKTPSVYFNVVRLPKVSLTDGAGVPFKRIALQPVAPDGTPLTKESSCLYDENGMLQAGVVTIALWDGKRLIPARAAVREKDGEIIMRTAAFLTDTAGERVKSFQIGKAPVLYALQIKENTLVRSTFEGAECCQPVYFTWTEEGVIGYQQRLLTSDEAAACCAESVAKKYLNDFANFSIACSNEYGRVTTAPIAFVIE